MDEKEEEEIEKNVDPATMKRALPIKIRFAEIRLNLVYYYCYY